jgi:hypothetical protein
MTGLVVSTIAFFIASWFIKRYFDESDSIPKGMTRSLVIFALALGVSYAAGAAADWIAGLL